MPGNTMFFQFLQIPVYSSKADKHIFVRVLTVHCDQNNSYEITINDFQVRNIIFFRRDY